MLDISRGKVYTRDYLLGLADLLGRMRYNVLQLYVEHTFDFKKHPDISAGSDPLTADDILAIQRRCKENGVELQANLQSLGHCNRILTREKYRHIAESDMY
ncbi:MAG: glycoside hydrolase, partial [Oscillospiraceae bacterium]|nr:glycoside hydrolase [Oscillospiraceae bacterium]